MAERKRSKTGTFTATEVGALIESLRNEIRVVAEGVADLRTKVDRIPAIEAKIEQLSVQTALIPALNAKLDALRSDLIAFDTRLKAVEAKVLA